MTEEEKEQYLAEEDANVLPTLIGSGRKCQWMEQSKNWEDCGAPATHVAPSTGMAYCERHAGYSISIPLVRIK